MTNSAFADLPLPGAGPLCVEVTRGAVVESRHAVHAVVRDAAGGTVAAWGRADRPTYPRSAIKALQAIPLVESGAADAFGLSPAELALACASHSAEAGHVATARAWLERLGLGPQDLACGPQRPRREADFLALVKQDRKPDRVMNNCSGKHLGMITLARHLGAPVAGYTEPDHPVQRAILRALGEMAEVDLGQAPLGVDGCSAPNPVVPLGALALAAARLAAPDGLGPDRARACRRLTGAMTAAPWMVGGTGKLDSVLMAAAAGRLWCKTGAEGAYLAFLPGPGLGIALKAEDGAGRAAEVALIALLRGLGLLDGALGPALAPFARPPVTNRVDAVVGEVRLGHTAF